MARMTDYIKNLFFLLILLQITPPLVKNIFTQYGKFLEPQSKVAYMDIKGIIYDSSFYTRHLREFFKQKDIKAIVLKIETPGGAAGSSESIAHEIELLKQQHPKPIVTMIENICTSGGYYVACVTDYIIATPSALIGSVGASVPYQFKVNELLKKYDIDYVPITAGKYKGSTDPFRPEDPEGTAMLQAIADDSYANFKEHVIKHRSQLSANNANMWADGTIVTGRQALNIGLIDEIGSASNVIQKIKELALIEEEIEWVKPAQSRGLAALLGYSDEESSLHIMAYTLNALYYRISDFLIK